MEQTRKSTGIQAHNGMMYVGDDVLYEDGWLSFVAKIVEVEGKIGFIFDEKFVELDEYMLGLDFEILPEDHTEWYGVHASLPCNHPALKEMREKAIMNNKGK